MVWRRETWWIFILLVPLLGTHRYSARLWNRYISCIGLLSSYPLCFVWRNWWTGRYFPYRCGNWCLVHLCYRQIYSALTLHHFQLDRWWSCWINSKSVWIPAPRQAWRPRLRCHVTSLRFSYRLPSLQAVRISPRASKDWGLKDSVQEQELKTYHRGRQYHRGQQSSWVTSDDDHFG